MSEFENTRYEIDDGAAWITLNCPQNRNALTAGLVEELLQHLSNALADINVRCIVLTGTGPAFCAGADLKSGGGRFSDQNAGRSPFVDILDTMWNSPKPVIAAINGAAFGGGLGLVAAADIGIAAQEAKFSFSEVRIGVIPAVISVVCLPKLGNHHGMRLFLTGERFDGAKAVEYGLVHKAVPGENLKAAVEEEIDAIRRGGPNAVAEAKQLVRKVPGMAMDDAFAWTEKKSAEMFRSDEASEGMAAFGQKRSPAWIKD